jgi:succinate-acetate transporter protein
MSDIDKLEYENGNGSHHAAKRTLTTVTLSPEQFEQLYLQPQIAGRQYSLSKTFGNPTPLGVSSFLLAHTALSMDLMGFRGATAASSVAMLGGFYACAGIGLYLACIMEWIMGNTFPSVVFGTFGGFWLSYAIINTPTMQIAASFAPAADAGNGITATMAGSQSPSFNVGLGMYFLVWGIMCFLYFVASLRTNVPFVLVFLSLVFAFELIASAYFHTASGNTAAAAMEFKVAGGFAFITALAGFWINFSLILASVGFPFTIPLIDLSSRFLVPKNMRGDEKMA